MSIGWRFDNIDKITQSNVECAVIDDQLWLSTGTNLQVWNLWGSIDKDELATQELLDMERSVKHDLNKPWFREPVKIFDQAIAGGISKFADGGDKVYLLSTDKMNIRWIYKDFSNKDSLPSPVVLDVAANSDMVYAYGKLWLVTDMDERKNNHLFVVNGATVTKTQIESKGQSKYNLITDGQNGFVYVARYEEGILAKFAGSTGTWTADVQVNAQPHCLGFSSDGYISVCAYSGCVSYISRVNDAVTHPYGLMSPMRNIQDLNDGYLWGMTYDKKGFIRLKKSDQKVVFTATGFEEEPQEDYTFEVLDFEDLPDPNSMPFRQLLATTQRSAQFWNGSSMDTVTVYPRLIFVTNSLIYIIRMKDTLHRKPYADLKGYGYITTFENDYSGG